MKQLIMLVLVVVASRVSLAAEKETGRSPLQLVVNLTDGSRLIGTTTLASLPMQSEMLGKFQVPLEKIRSINFGKDHESITVLLANNDTMQGSPGKATLTLRTIFGEVAVPFQHVTTINVRFGTRTAEEFNPDKPYGSRFDGKKNYVEVTDSTTWATKALTAECWIRSPSSGNLQAACISTGYRWTIRASTHGIVWIGVSDNAGHAWEIADSPNFNDGNWHHVAGVWDGSVATLYVDGKLRGTQNFAGALKDSQLPLTIGSATPTLDRYAGDIAEVRLSKISRYEGKDFTPAHGFGIDDNTIGYWKLNEASGSIAHDQSDNKHDGTLRGDPPPQWISEEPR